MMYVYGRSSDQDVALEDAIGTRPLLLRLKPNMRATNSMPLGQPRESTFLPAAAVDYATIKLQGGFHQTRQ
jgi:hypothetical protein